MAAFNPDVPDVQPGNYLNWSKPTEYKPNESSKYSGEATKIALSTAGEALDTAATVAEKYVKEGIIKPQVEAEQRALQDQYTVELDAKRNSLRASGISPVGDAPVDNSQTSQADDGMNAMAKGSLLPNAVDDSVVFDPKLGMAPTSIDRTLGNLTTLKASSDQGKMTETEYYGKLNSNLKSLRARFPGWRDYIDQEAEKITGVNAANAYIKSSVSEINNMQTKLNSGLEKDLTEARKVMGMELPPWQKTDVATMMELRKNGGKSSYELNAYVNDVMMWQNRFKSEEAQRAALKGRREDQQVTYKANAETEFEQAPVSWLNSKHAIAGEQEPAAFKEYIEKRQRGEAATDPVVIQQAVQQLQAGRQEVEASLRLKAMRGGIKSYDSVLGSEYVEGLIKRKMAVFDEYTKAITDDRFGLATATLRQNNAYLSANDSRLLNSKAATYLANLHSVNSMGGPQAAAAIVGPTIVKLMDEGTAAWARETNIGLTAPFNPASKGQFNNFRSAIEDANAKGGDGGLDIIKAVNSVMDLHKRITDPDIADPAKQEIIKKAYDPKSKGYIGLFNKEELKPDGTETKGQFAKAGIAINDDITKEVWKQSKLAHDPQIWNNYAEFAKTTVGHDLLGGALATLNEYKGIHFGWDDKASHIIPLTEEGRPFNEASRQMLARAGIRRSITGQNQAELTVGHVNEALDKIKVIAQVENPDPKAVSAFMYKYLVEAGYDPAKANVDQPATQALGDAARRATGDTLKAIGRALKNNSIVSPNEEPSVIPHFGPEERRVQSAQDFMRNPVPSAKDENFEERKQELIKQEAERSGTLTKRDASQRWYEYMDRNK